MVSTLRISRSKRLALLGVVMLGATGCAAAPAPLRARYADVGKGALANYRGERPLIIEFLPGDRLPIALRVESDDFKLVPAQPALEFVAKRRCFVRFGADGIRSSTDGVHFDEKPREPGRFRIGFSATKTSPPKLEIEVAAPRH